MTIVKAKDSIEAYRALANAKNINEMTGRTGRPDLTDFVTSQMSKKIQVKKNSTIVDIGCGDGQYLLKSTKNLIEKFKGKLIGILPTQEEMRRLKKHLKMSRSVKISLNPKISIKIGNFKNTNLPKSYSDIIVCNGVLNLAGTSLEDIKIAFSEFSRIAKKNCVLFIGEMPERNEFSGKDYKNSIFIWLYWVFKNLGIRIFFKKVKQTILALLTKEPFIIYPKKNFFFMKPENFIKLAKQYNFGIKEYYRHLEIDENGKEYFSNSRLNYLFFKKL